ncbi:monovalent cation/H(+) antiporter subunit G [Desulfuromonas sp. TF]|jgi:multicomponent Na+:H+ antiporter subunit G|uniref:monovalent cation/H(+) antiporter subunit G n=1 Tax=Desulfuromonas sp. TF TaxID=1232410 RepID=UPI000422FB2C|nr:monovalent cation/H(+) antiporter subunit G [Desulfuromonas sp. TF]
MSVVAALLIVAGLFFFAIGVLGILRFPDFYTRLHAAGKCDSLAAVLVVLGIALFNLQEFSGANLLVSIKIMFVAAFVFVASPTATHAITEAALVIGVEPWTKEKKQR